MWLPMMWGSAGRVQYSELWRLACVQAQQRFRDRQKVRAPPGLAHPTVDLLKPLLCRELLRDGAGWG